ncbi:MAG: hypothetical protein CMJ47_07610 [Planctomyces sp.]|uniref:hypothetical protein n=1 Tax=Rubinisphaera sp. JC750 TaxID=2898658 RepID=UPI000C3BF2FD|nr:hypothetical protein [Rubinisphaera sp. JC750]MBB02494.1 hypothetical protein [Planctomyces sp.]
MTWVRLGLMLLLGLPSAALAATPAVPALPHVQSIFHAPALAVMAWQDEAAARADDAEFSENGNTSSAVDSTEEDLTPAEKERRKNYLSIAWLLLIGVGVIGLLLLLMVLFIGSSIRRVARTPAPNATLRDQLWYLKPDADKNSSDEDKAAGDQTDGEKKHDS